MSKYKLVPIEPTHDMERAAESYWNERRFKGLSDDPRTWAGVYQSMLDAAEQQPAPDVSVLVEALEEARLTLEVMQGRGSSAGLTLAIIDRALAAYRTQGGDV